MIATSTHPFRIDADHDRDSASDGVSRYGAYLRRHTSRLSPWDEGVGGAAEFAAAAWEIGSSPIMAPGYVQYGGGRVLTARMMISPEHETLLARIELAVPAPPVLVKYHRLHEREQWNGWECDDRGRYYPPDEADLARRTTILTTAQIVVPVPVEQLHTPAAELQQPGALMRHADLLTAEAKAAVHRLVFLLNARIAPLLQALDGGR
jgi:hypothetical protein